MKWQSFYTDFSNYLVLSKNPFYPKCKNDPQAELKHPPFLDPNAVGEMYIPPGQVEKVKYWFLLISEFR